MSPAEPTIGDEITLEIRVEAEPQVEVLMPEFGEALNRYTILNFVPRQRIDDHGKTVLTQLYTLQPYLSGPQSIPPILIEFVDHRAGPEAGSGRFRRLRDPDRSDRFPGPVGRARQDAARELKPPLGELDLVADRSRSTGRGRSGGSLAALAAVVAAWILLAAPATAGPPPQRLRSGPRAARSSCCRARGPRIAAAIEAFFVAISSIVRRYLEDRFELRAPELTTEEFLALAGSASHLSHDHQHLLRDFLRQADLVKFAGVRASEDGDPPVERSGRAVPGRDARERAADRRPGCVGDPQRCAAGANRSRRTASNQLPCRGDGRMFDWEFGDPWFLLLVRARAAGVLAGHGVRRRCWAIPP